MLALLRFPVRACARRFVVAALALLPQVVGSCRGSSASPAGTSASEWSGGIPDPDSAVVSLENLSYDPARILGLVGNGHPAAGAEDANLRRAGIKRVPAERMEVLLGELVSRGFCDSAHPLVEFAPANPELVLRRLVIAAGGERFAVVLPRRPTQAAADRFNRLAHAVQAMFNEVVDFRLEGSEKSSTHFHELQQRLFDAERRRRGPGRAP
jgi:hypothetical protein